MPKGRMSKIVKKREEKTNQMINKNKNLNEILYTTDTNSWHVKFQNKEKIVKECEINDNDIRCHKLKKRLQEKLKK